LQAAGLFLLESYPKARPFLRKTCGIMELTRMNLGFSEMFPGCAALLLFGPKRLAGNCPPNGQIYGRI